MQRKTTLAERIGIVKLDSGLEPFEGDIRLRIETYKKTKQEILIGGTVYDFANGEKFYGFHKYETCWIYREWAPNADALHLTGEFNNWNRTSHPLIRSNHGLFSIILPLDTLKHGQAVLVSVTANGETRDRIPLYIKATRQDSATNAFVGIIWDEPFKWTDSKARKTAHSPMYIYEAHVGMAQEDGKVGTYDEFTANILPRVVAAGYNTIQLMAVMEHPYYASFGYQVSNFFAPSSRFGDPNGLKRLINAAHNMRLNVLLDIVHAHASANTAEGIANFDGTDDQFFLRGKAGWHSAWNTRVFDYSDIEVIHFLLSNIKYWMEEYHFDGFRFDGVTSMLYNNHGLGSSFMDYKAYYSMNTNIHGCVYLMLANELIHMIKKGAVTIAEDVSGMPGLCRPIAEGGFGFDARLAMGEPDFWIDQLKRRDEDFDIRKMWHELTTRRPMEKVIGYCESHDQALVGDKTLIFRLADSDMYHHMAKATANIRTERAIAIIKCIKLLTLTLGGDGYLNFMGNEFGHPEWVDFPREGNGNSFHYARRQWSLVDNPDLLYESLAAFDRDALAFAAKNGILGAEPRSLWIDDARKIVAYRKKNVVFAVNMHPTESVKDFYLPVHQLGEWKAVFSTDDAKYGGKDRAEVGASYIAEGDDPRGVGFFIYLPCRCAVGLVRDVEDVRRALPS